MVLAYSIRKSVRYSRIVEPVFALKTLLRVRGLMPTIEASVSISVSRARLVNQVILHFMHLRMEMIAIIKINTCAMVVTTSARVYHQAPCHRVRKSGPFKSSRIARGQINTSADACTCINISALYGIKYLRLLLPAETGGW